MSHVVYSFGEFRLKIAGRELWQRDALLPVTRVVFDCIAYLIEHRDRAVGRDELVAAIWGRVDVSEGHLNQVIVRARRALGDGGQPNQAIRTVQRFGYRWVGDVEVVTEAKDERPPLRVVSARPAPANDARQQAAEETPAPSPRTSDRERRSWVGLSVVALATAGLIAAAAYSWWPTPQPTSTGTARTPVALHDRDGSAVVVLPLEVEASGESGWVALGAMDLIAERLRKTQLPVPPSETVIAALHGLASPPTPMDLASIRERLGAGLVVKGKAIRSNLGWTVQLVANSAADSRHRAEARRDDVIQAARAAADLLLVALGRTPPDGDGDGETQAMQERLQQARVAMLTSQFDLARNILSGASVDAKSAADVRILLAEVDFRAGRLDQAADAIATLLVDPQIQGNPLRRARALILRGNLSIRRSAFAEARPDFDAAITELGPLSAPLDLGDALTRRGLIRTWFDDFDGAAADFSRARPLAEQAGDRLRIAHVDAGFGQLQIERQRLDLALPYLDAAIDQYETFGVIDRAVTLRNLLNDTYASLLRWSDALAISDRQWAMRNRVGGDPGLAVVIVNRRGRLLIALGRNREAEELLADAQQRHAGVRPETRRYLYDLQAELAWRQGRHEATISAVEHALETWPRDPSFDRYAYLVLLRQRALIASGRLAPEPIERWLPADSAEGLSVVFLVALAEWAAYKGADTDAADRFDRAIKAAESAGTPALVALVAQSYTDWLLARGQLEKALELAGRVAVWAREDFDCALLRVKVFHALGRRDTWSLAVEQAMAVAGERSIPESLRAPPGPG